MFKNVDLETILEPDWKWADYMINQYLANIKSGFFSGPLYPTISPDSQEFDPKTGNHLYFDYEAGLMATVLVDDVFVSKITD